MRAYDLARYLKKNGPVNRDTVKEELKISTKVLNEKLSAIRLSPRYKGDLHGDILLVTHIGKKHRSPDIVINPRKKIPLSMKQRTTLGTYHKRDCKIEGV